MGESLRVFLFLKNIQCLNGIRKTLIEYIKNIFLEYDEIRLRITDVTLFKHLSVSPIHDVSCIKMIRLQKSLWRESFFSKKFNGETEFEKY